MKWFPLLMLLLLSGQPCWAAGTSLETAQLPIIRIDTDDLSPQQIGLEEGRQSKQLFPDIERRYDAHLASIITKTHFDAILQHQLPDLLKQLDTHWQEEMEGVLSAWLLSSNSVPGDGQLSLEEYQILNLLPDLGLAPDGSGLGAFSNAAAEETTVVGQNLDWASTPELRSLQTITIYQDDDDAVVSIGFAGLVSVLHGFNNRGLFLAIINAEPYSPYQQYQIQEDKVNLRGFALRQALTNLDSASSAARWLKGQVYGFSSNTLIADRKTVEVLEHPANAEATVRYWDSTLRADKSWGHPDQIAVVDCLVLPDMPDNCRDAQDAVRWQRLQELAQFGPTHQAKPADISTIMLDKANPRYEILNHHTLQSLVYVPAHNSLYLYAAPLEGEHPPEPVQQAYPDLLPPERHFGIRLVWIIWLVLLVMLAGIWWVRRKNIQPQQIKL